MIGLVDGNNFFVSCERVVNPRLRGKAVAVLSNNDGCCVSRSNEFKALGIPMGTPHFQLKEMEASGRIICCSSNFELYGDLSARIISILSDMTAGVEQYSIDEAYIVPPSCHEHDLLGYGRSVRSRILQWVGIPCGVGFAPTKTLAKIANHIGKKTPGGVFVLPEDPTEILSGLPVSEVWGVGRRLAPQLRAAGIFTARELRDATEDRLRRLGSIMLVHTAQELKGVPALDDRGYNEDPDSVSCSRSFGGDVMTLQDLEESISSFCATGAAKLRRHGLVVSGCQIYARYGTFERQSCTEANVVFPVPTDATHVMLAAIRPAVSRLYAPGRHYRKTGIVFFGLEKAGTARQLDLFSKVSVSEKSPLYAAIDHLNGRLGRGAVFSLAQGLRADAEWRMNRGKISPRATTRWDELITVS